MMVISNFLFDLYLFAGCAWCYSGFWLYFARATAAIFLAIVGISLTLSYSRDSHFSKFLKRGLRIFAYGLILTAVTFIFLGENAVLFGILHLIGASIILSYPFIERKGLALAGGLVLIGLGFFIRLPSQFFWLANSPGYSSVDYNPILPWFGIVLIGIFLGRILYPESKPKLSLRDNILSKIGRKSLLIYLAHQPVILALLSLYFGRLPLQI